MLLRGRYDEALVLNTGKSEDQIDVYFDNFNNFKKIFSEIALSIQGSGWCWLVFNALYHKIEIITTPNQDSPWTLNRTPLLGLDMWEHAYYLKYQNKKSDYVALLNSMSPIGIM